MTTAARRASGSLAASLAAGVRRVLPACCVLVAFGAAASAAERCALVIANGAYEYLPALTRPAGDARLVAEALRSAGFVVTSFGNTSAGSLAALFDASCRDSAIAVVYYAGHGVQQAGESFMIAIDAKPADAELAGVPASGALGRLASDGRQAVVFIYDAARRGDIAGTAVTVRAAIPVRPQPGTNEAVLWSTAPGAGLVEPADGGNGAFALALSKALSTPGLSFEALTAQVRADVARATDGRQAPWLASSLANDITLVAQ